MARAKKQELPTSAAASRPLGPGLWPGLWIVATPIGNLADLSARARQALESAEAIYCEDTRHAAKLLSALGIAAESRLERLDAHASPGTIEKAADFARAAEARGAGVALVTDAGTPAISDPGAKLVALAHSRGVRVIPVPGPSAMAALLSVCGFDETSFTFRGFFPRSDRERTEELATCARSLASRVYAWFESPHRITDAMKAIAAAAPEAQVVATKELTKIHERIFQGNAGEVSSEIEREIEREGQVGEWAFALRFPEITKEKSENFDAGSSNAWEKAIQCMLDARVPASEAARQVSQHFGEPRKKVYERALELAGKKTNKGY